MPWFLDLTIFNFSYDTVNGKYCCNRQPNPVDDYHDFIGFQYRQR